MINPAEDSLARIDGAKGKVTKSRCEYIVAPEIDAMMAGCWIIFSFLPLSAECHLTLD